MEGCRAVKHDLVETIETRVISIAIIVSEIVPIICNSFFLIKLKLLVKNKFILPM
jgi:hypothetical protein